MSFLETLDRARSHLERNGRVSLRALAIEFSLDDESLEVLVEELVEIQGVAVREGKALAWSGGASSAPAAPPSEARATPSAEAAAESRPVLEGERKQATVLFADIKGSTALAESAGAEKWAGILNGCIRILEAGIRRFDGTLSQYTGDGAMALFGAPIAQEDHAQRACLSALWLRDALRDYAEQVRNEHGLLLETRIGLNSGEVIVGKIGDDLGIDFTAQGQTVHLAQRMEQLAESLRPRLTAATAGLVAGLFALDDLGEFDVKGASKPLRVYGLTGLGEAHTRLDAARTRGLTGFVGRSHEMASLDGALAQAREGKGQIVGVVGEAGVGKSRLCSEFLERVEASGVPIYSARCLSHGQTLSFLPIYELLRSLLGGVSESEPEAVQRRRIEVELLGIDRTLEEVLPLVFEFLNIADPERPVASMPAEARQRQLFNFAQRLIHAKGDHEPSVLFLDDAHWIDPASNTFLARLVEAVSEARVLLLVNFRPEYHADWMEQSDYQQISLKSLGVDETDALLGQLLGRDQSLTDLSKLIRTRTRGNPFFVEEVVRSLDHSGQLEGHPGAYRLQAELRDLDVPATVQPVIAGRIDQLPMREKQVLQAAAVIGREFSEVILLEVLVWRSVDLTEALQSLKAGEFIHEQSLYPVVEYAFKHPLTQEVALDSQLAGRRTKIHVAVARALELVHASRLDEQAALIANHYEEAGHALDAARWHQRAAVWLVQSGPFESDFHWRRVYDLAKSVESDPASKWMALEACIRRIMGAFLVGLPDSERDRFADEGRALAEELESTWALFMLEVAIVIEQTLGGWMTEAPLARVEHVLELSEGLGSELRILSRVVHGNVCWTAGRVEEALASTEQAIELSAGDLDVGVDMYGFSVVNLAVFQKASLLTWQGRLREGKDHFDWCIAVARARGELGILSQMLGTLGADFGELSGESEWPLALCREALEQAERYGDLFGCTVSLLHLSWAQVAAGRAAEALEPLERVDHRIRERRLAKNFFNVSQGLLAEAHLAAGNFEQARSAADRCTLARDTWVQELRANISRSRVLRGLDGAGGKGEIEASLDRAEQLLEMSGAHAFAPMIAEERARLLEGVGDSDGATRTLREALRLFEDIGATGHVERLRKELGA